MQGAPKQDKPSVTQNAPHSQVHVHKQERLERQQRPGRHEHRGTGCGADRLRDSGQRQHTRAYRAADYEENGAEQRACIPDLSVCERCTHYAHGVRSSAA